MGGMGKRNRADVLAHNLPQLQNLIKRDPQSYRDEFLQQYKHFTASLDIFMLKPSEESVEFEELVNFIAQVSTCYPKETKGFAQQLIDLLSAHHNVMAPGTRMAVVQALMLLRNRDVIPTINVLPLFFTLFRCKDKALRATLRKYIVTDIKNANAKHRNNKLNKTLQNYMYTVFKESDEIAAQKSLEVMIDLYKKGVWKDGKTVNVVAEACFSPMVKVHVTAVGFFLGSDEPDDDDDEDEAVDMMGLKHTILINKKTKSRKTQYQKAVNAVKKKERKKNKPEAFNFSALQMLNDPQGFAERLFSRLRNSSGSSQLTFTFRLQLMNLITRLIGVHKLLLLQYYEFVLPYLKPHQKEVMSILAYTAQATHELVPPDAIQPVVQGIADGFVWGNAATEVVVAGLNAIREICARSPLAMSESLLQSLMEDYKNHQAKGAMNAARALLALYREVNPHMLKKKDRGKTATMNLKDFKVQQYGEVRVASGVDGAELLRAREEAEMNGEDPGEGWEGWEIDSEGMAELDSDEEDDGRKIKKGKPKKALKVEVIEGDGDGDGGDEGWEDEDGEGDGWEDVDEEGDGDDGSDSEDEAEEEEEEEFEEEETNELIAKNRNAKAAARVSPGKRKRDAEPEPQKTKKAKKNETKIVHANGTSRDETAVPSARPELEKIFTDEDFKKIRTLRMRQEVQKMAGKRGAPAQDVFFDSDDEEEMESEKEPDFIDPNSLLKGLKKHRRELIEQQRKEAEEEEKVKHGSKKGKKERGSTTNREKAKKNKAFKMVAQGREVRGKAKRSMHEKTKTLRAHIKRQKLKK